MPTRDPTAAERARRYRDRINEHLCVVPLEVGEADIDYLVLSGALDSKTDNRRKIAEAVKHLLEKVRHAYHEPGGE